MALRVLILFALAATGASARGARVAKRKAAANGKHSFTPINENIWKPMTYSFRTHAYGLNFAEPAQPIFDAEGSDFDALYWSQVKSETSVTEGSEETAIDAGVSFGVSGNYGAFAASVQTNLNRFNSESVQTVRVSKKTRAEMYRVSALYADPWNRVKPAVLKRMREESVVDIVLTYGEFYAESIILGGQFETMHIMEKTQRDTKTSMSMELEASYNVVLVGSVTGNTQGNINSTTLINNYKMRTSWHMNGGNSTIWLSLTDDNFAQIQAQWAESVRDDNLFPVEIRFAPIWKLLEPFDPQKAQQLEEYLISKWSNDLINLPDYLPAGFISEMAARRQEGFNRIWALSSGAAWHAANAFKGYHDDKVRDLERRDTAAIRMSYDFQNSTLQPLANSLKWMAQDYAWYAVNHLWNDHNEANSPDFPRYVRYREDAKAILNSDTLFWTIHDMIKEHVWVAAHTRYWGREEPWGKALAHKDILEEILVQRLAAKSWPLYEPEE